VIGGVGGEEKEESDGFGISPTVDCRTIGNYFSSVSSSAVPYVDAISLVPVP
jgi:hypothetical protein